MTRPVDVLAGLRLAARDCTAQGNQMAANELLDIKAAVAELIEAAVKFRAAQKAVEAGATLRKYRRRDSAGTQLDIALARVGGAS